jgi:DNA-binding CsgD family transcriptional regulator
LGNIGTTYISLTNRQLTCLRWVAVGKSFEEIGGLMGIPQAQVEGSLAEVRELLGARSLIHAICMVHEVGLIDAGSVDCHDDVFR